MVPLAEIQFGPFALEHTESLLATLVGFVLLVFLLVRYAMPPIRTQLAERITHIETVQAEAERHLAEARQIRDDYATRIAQIEVEHRNRLDAAVREADAARAQMIADAQETARALRRRAEEEIARERTRQRILMRRQLVQITVDAAEQSVRTLNSEDSQRRLIADFIARVSGPPVAAVRSGIATPAAEAGAMAQSQTQMQGGA